MKMDYLKRAEEVRDINSAQLTAHINQLMQATGSPDASQIAILIVSNQSLGNLAAQLLVVDTYIRYIKDEPAQSRAEALEHFIYAQESAACIRGDNVGNCAVLRFQLLNEDYQPPQDAA
jgi:hypothetical protein